MKDLEKKQAEGEYLRPAEKSLKDTNMGDGQRMSRLWVCTTSFQLTCR